MKGEDGSFSGASWPWQGARGGTTEHRRWETAVSGTPTGRANMTGLSGHAREMQSCRNELLGGGAMTAMNFASELELCGGDLGRRKDRRGPTAWLK